MDYPSMYHAAMEYIKMGLAVFPLEERGKRPITRNGCKDATTDAAQVKAWWQQYPESNIGIATGSRSGGIFVIDLDVDEDRGIDGYHMLEDWQRENGRFPDTWTAITGRGGYHLYFKYDSEVRNRAGIIDGVDIRGEGGYVVAPPSIHSKRIWENDILRGHKNDDDLVRVVFGEFNVIDVDTLETVDRVAGWHTEVIETDALSKCEPFCLPMPLADFYIKRSEFEVFGNIFDNADLL